MAQVTIRDLKKCYGSTRMICGVDLNDEGGLFVAGFIGTIRVGGKVEVAGLEWPVAAAAGRAEDTAVTCGVRPEALILAEDGIEMAVAVVEPTGSETHVIARMGDQEVVSVFRNRETFRPNETIRLKPADGAVHLFDATTGQRISETAQ